MAQAGLPKTTAVCHELSDFFFSCVYLMISTRSIVINPSPIISSSTGRIAGDPIFLVDDLDQHRKIFR